MDEEVFQDNRFAQILEPVRDLAKNWDIDLVSLLESCLHDMETFNVNIMPISQTQSSQPPSSDNGVHSSMNFAQAAFLIQASAQIYSKKVEYLYELTLNLWEYLSKKNAEEERKRTNVSNEPENANDELAVRMQTRQSKKNRCQDEDDDEPLASLDDIEVSSDVDMNDEIELVHKKRKRTNKNLKLIKSMPLDLVPLEDYEKSDIPLISNTGEIVGKKDDYRVNTCFMHGSGAMLLDLANVDLINVCDESDSIHQCPTPPLSNSPNQNRMSTEVYTENMSQMNSNSNGISGVPKMDSPTSACYPNQISPTLPAGGQTNLTDDRFADRDESDGMEQFEQELNQTQIRNKSFIDHELCRADNKIRENLTLERSEKIGDEQKRHELPDRNALELLDEFEKCQNKLFQEKPAGKCRKTYRIPGCIKNKRGSNAEDDHCKKRKKDSEKTTEKNIRDWQKNQRPKETLSQFFDAVLFGKRKTPNNPLKTVEYAELDDLFHDEQKRRRNMLLKAARLRSGKVISKPEPADFVSLTAIKNKSMNKNGQESVNETLLERNLLAIFEGPDLDDSQSNEIEAKDGDEILMDNDKDVDLVDQDFAGPGNSTDYDSEPDRLSKLSATRFQKYEDLVKYNIEQHLLKAQQDAHLTDLAQRVREWEEKISPSLLAEENYRAFDISLYGDEILLFLKHTNPNTPLLFADFAAKKEQYEICRYTLASLMLANHGNVEISSSDDPKNTVNTMKLRYLTSERTLLEN